jgi:uroporphyrinogen decarboxylase
MPKGPNTMNKRENVLSLLDRDSVPDVTPAGFFLHFDPRYHSGPAAVEKHLAYFRHTGMDMVKIQYERGFPHRPEIATPDDWKDMPLYGEDFYRGQLAAVEGLVKAAKHEALILVTLYSPFMCASQTTSGQMITDHILKNPEATKKGLEIITESMMIFVKACIRLGVDGFYASTQGAEGFRFADIGPFDECIRPYDLAIMNEINDACAFNILHICDYNGGYDDLTPFVGYPGDVVNASLKVGTEKLSGKDVSRMFDRPFMGGMERKGVIVHGSRQEITARVSEVLRDAPDRTILGADCTVPSDVDWDNLRTAISAAHAFKRG